MYGSGYYANVGSEIMTALTDLRQITTYVNVNTFNKIEDARSHISRSAFVANVLEIAFDEYRIGVD